MIATIATILCLAYILGLLLTGIPGSVAGIPTGAILILFVGVGVAVLIRRVWRMAPRAEVWLSAGLVGMAAVLYFQIRLPVPSQTDLCHIIWSEPLAAGQVNDRVNCQPSLFANAGAKLFHVEGTVVSPPRLTRSNRLQFELAAAEVSQSIGAAKALSQRQTVTGKVYVTIPKSAGEQLYPGLTVQVEGSLYKPKPAANPGGFDFEKYLAQQGIFTGLNGQRLIYPSNRKPAPPLFWSIRQQIRQVQAMGLGQPEAALVSAMVMGKSAVDVPYDLQDQFKQTGLAHALAASGAQVSLLIGVVLALTQRLSSRVRLGIGTAILVLYLGLTGIEPSVLRAGVMGFVALLALTANRKVKPTGSLLLAATLLLLLNPLWIWNLGFQLSFLATLGLLVTVPILTQWLDWMPSAIIPMFAVPISAYIWTLPLMLSTFGIVSPYSIIVNVLASPFIAIISIGGMISAVGALIYPAVGSFLAWLLYYPTHVFIKIAETGSQIPGNTFAVGTIHAVQVLLLYGAIVLVWQWKKLQPYWWIAGLMSISLVAVPVGYAAAHLSQVTVLATPEEPVLVIQDQGRVGIIHSADLKNVQFTVLPFLRKQGINHLNWAIAENLNAAQMEGWKHILESISVDIFYTNFDPPRQPSELTQTYHDLLAQVKTQQGIALPLIANREMQQGSIAVEVIEQVFSAPSSKASAKSSSRLDALRLELDDQTWLLIHQIPDWKEQSKTVQFLPAASVLGWSGKALNFKLLEQINPKMAIIFGDHRPDPTQAWLERNQVNIHAITQDGAIQWSGKKGFVGVGSEL